jgi:hypothetical protein
MRVIPGPIFSTDKATRETEIDAIIAKNEWAQDWYQEWHDWMNKFVKDKGLSQTQINRHIKLQALLSQGRSPQGNQKLYKDAVDALESAKPGQQIDHTKINGMSEDMARKAERIWSGREEHLDTLQDRIDLYGKKVGAYMHTGLNPMDPEAAVVDRHMPRAWGYNGLWGIKGPTARTELPTRVVEEVQQEIREAAARNNLTPGQVQAALWFDIRPPGSEVDSYSEAFRISEKYKPVSLGGEAMELQEMVEEGQAFLQTAPHATTYAEASKTKGNVYVRSEDAGPSNHDRVLVLQISSQLSSPTQLADTKPKEEQYYDKLYSQREGFVRPDDFWELPEWMAMAKGAIPNSDVYIVRNEQEAIDFLNNSGYGSIMFGTMEVNKSNVKNILKGYTGAGKVLIGGYAAKGDFKGYEWHEDITSAAKSLGHPGDERSDYSLFKGTKTIPRLCMSTGCAYKCAFCDIPTKVTVTPRQVINNQIESFKDF